MDGGLTDAGGNGASAPTTRGGDRDGEGPYPGRVTAEKTWRARTSTGQLCQHVTICDAEVGEVVEVTGTVHTVTLHPSGGVESFEADVSDETGMVHLVWLGRRRLTGIVPSRRISARGRVALRDGRKVIFNPEYELTIPGTE